MAPEGARPEQVRTLCVERRSWIQTCLWLLLLVLWAVLGVRGVLAQEPGDPNDLRIQRLSVQVMPEFDDPRVLVMVQGRVEATGQEFPVAITFRVPYGAQINQMATVNMESAGATAAEYDRRRDPENARWELVTYELEGAHFFYEYYYDPIVGEVEKAFTYILSSYHSVGEATVQIQEPSEAEGFVTVPEAVERRVDQNLRLNYHEIPLGALAAGEERAVSVSYRKSDPNPSLTWEQVMALQEGKRPPEVKAVEESTGSGMEIPTEVVVFVGGALLILGGIAVGFRLQRGGAGEERGEGEKQYCRMCGSVLKAEANYCHQCGAMVLQAMGTLEQMSAAGGGPGRERR